MAHGGLGFASCLMDDDGLVFLFFLAWYKHGSQSYARSGVRSSCPTPRFHLLSRGRLSLAISDSAITIFVLSNVPMVR